MILHFDTSLKTAFRLALIAALFLATYITWTVFIPFSYSIWLTLHNTLVILSLFGAFCVGLKYRTDQKTFRKLLWGLIVYFSIIMLLYVGSYTVTTGLFSTKMKWIPFFYRDYEYHGFTSVHNYLNHDTNFIDLLVLQIISLFISSVLYLTAGTLGYFIQLRHFKKSK